MEMLFTALRLIEGSVLLLNVIISEHKVIWCRSTSRCRFLHFSKWNLVTFPRPASACVGQNLQLDDVQGTTLDLSDPEWTSRR